MINKFVEIPAHTEIWSIKLQQSIYLNKSCYGEVKHITIPVSDYIYVQMQTKIFGKWVNDNSFGEVGVMLKEVKEVEKIEEGLNYFDYKYEQDLGEK